MNKLGIAGFFILVIGLLSFPAFVSAFDYSGSLTSLARMWNIDRSNLDESDLFRFRLYEYLFFNAEGSKNFSIPVYGRGSFDLGKEGDSTGDLIYGYLDWHNNTENLSVKAGRQLNFHSEFPVFFDGAQVSYRFRQAYYAEFFTGVNFYPGRDWSSKDLLFGFRTSYEGNEKLNAGLSYLQSYLQDDPEHRALGLDFSSVIIPKLEIRGYLNYDFLFDLFYDSNIHANGEYRDKFSYWFNFTRYVPSGFLPANSIFTVFSFEKVQEFAGQVEVAAKKWIRPYLESTYRDFGVDSSTEFNIGARIYPEKFRLDYLSASYNYEGGYAGKFQDIYLKGRVLVNPKLSLSTRVTVYLYGDEITDRVFLPAFTVYPDAEDSLYGSSNRANSFSIYLGSLYDFSPQMSAAAGLDYSRTPYLDNDVRGIFKFTYRFWSPIKVKGGDQE
jgi:hypothetical protein